jgi:hypothetical protein
MFNLLDGTAMTRLLQETRSLCSTVHVTVNHNDLKPVGVTLNAKEPRGWTVLECNADIGRRSRKQYPFGFDAAPHAMHYLKMY